MPMPEKSLAACVCAGAALMAVAACGPRSIAPVTVSDLMEDRVALDGVLLKCNQNPVKARSDADCQNARIAIDRLADRVDPAQEAKLAREFEHNRELLRMSQERLRQDQEAKTKVDAYHLPLVPVEPAAPAAASTPVPPAAPSGENPPVARDSGP